jgi:hypothetical protein
MECGWLQPEALFRRADQLGRTAYADYLRLRASEQGVL